MRRAFSRGLAAIAAQRLRCEPHASRTSRLAWRLIVRCAIEQSIEQRAGFRRLP